MAELVEVSTSLETYFAAFRQNIIGVNTRFDTPFGTHKIVYADWTASGRMYAPIERALTEGFGQYVANTHTETNLTGSTTTLAYHEARQIIKNHVGANAQDVLLMVGSGMTAAVNKWQRILGLRIPEQYKHMVKIPKGERPVVFITHMEHHSNQTSWIETIAEVVVIPPTADAMVDTHSLEILLAQYADRPLKIAAITACSNITGIQTPYHTIAGIMHRAGGYCFADFACSAPYVPIDMHPAHAPDEYLDAIYFSPHKFLGGPGSAGVLVFNSSLYHLKTPDQPGGGTVKWTNPWGEHSYIDDIEAREDGGTPPFMQTIRTALCVQLKEKMGIDNIMDREHELVHYFLPKLKNIEGVNVLASDTTDRLAVISFYIKDLHYNFCVKLLNDRFGIQVRGGCSCAGTYGHYLLEVDKAYSHSITDKIDRGDLSEKPGWVRLSLHPTSTTAELDFLLHAVQSVAKNFSYWAGDYIYNCNTNEYEPKLGQNIEKDLVRELFNW